MKIWIAAALLLLGVAGMEAEAQSYPKARKKPKASRPIEPSRVLPKGTVYTDKQGEDWQVTAPGQRMNVTDRPRDPATGRLYKPGQRVNATKIGKGYPGRPSINPSTNKQGYPGAPGYPGQP